MFVVNLALDLPLRTSYSYLSTEKLSAGQRVIVEFRNKLQVAIVLGTQDASQFSERPLDQLKPIFQISNPQFNLPPQILELCQFCANYYHHPLGPSLFSALPARLRKIDEPAVPPANLDYYQVATQPTAKMLARQPVLWQELALHPLKTEQIKQIIGKNPRPWLTKWLAQGYIQKVPPLAAHLSNAAPILNDEQQQVVTTLSQQLDSFSCNLLYGITGSGKTEVFLHLIAEVLKQQRQVLVLVPEINLTPQLAARFSQRFPYAYISLLNSEVSDNQRLTAWYHARNGSCHIVLGTRLSVFTPFQYLGLIIVDEEHDESYKQNDGLRYHARDLAVWRARQLNCPLILASATPSLETLYNYHQGKYKLFKLSKRAVADANLPRIDLINLLHNPVNYAGISEPALTALAACLARKELAMVFLNRRGYAPIITCYECGWVSSCRYCSSKMVYHHPRRHLRCHQCGYQTQVPPHCPNCNNQYLHTIGHGTQKLEEFLINHFPEARIKRIDRDTTNRKSAWQTIYQQVANDEIDILLGTQMLAKGHDFPRLTLVVGLNLDNALFSYDFRASEDMFSMLTQVAGRAGRAKHPGLVLLQTNYPEHPLYHFLRQHDFNGFINHTLAERRHSQLPPFSHFALIKLSSLIEAKLTASFHDLWQIAKKIPHPQVTLNPPLPAVMYKLHNRYRGQMLISSNCRKSLHNYLAQLSEHLHQFNQVTINVDVDPYEV